MWGSLVLIQAWLKAGSPVPKVKPLGGFEAWSRVIGGILEHAGIPGFLEGQLSFYETVDSEGEAWRGFTTAWWEKWGTAPVGVSELLTLASELDCFPLGAGSDRSQKITFGKLLAKKRDNVFGNLRIVLAGTIHRVKRWRLEEVGRAVNVDIQ